MLLGYWLLPIVFAPKATVTNNHKAVFMENSLCLQSQTLPYNMRFICKPHRNIKLTSTTRKQTVTQMATFTLSPSPLKHFLFNSSFFLYRWLHVILPRNILLQHSHNINHNLINKQLVSYPSTKASRGIASESKQERLERNTEICKGHNKSDYE
jgi:hypothetical protein